MVSREPHDASSWISKASLPAARSTPGVYAAGVVATGPQPAVYQPGQQFQLLDAPEQCVTADLLITMNNPVTAWLCDARRSAITVINPGRGRCVSITDLAFNTRKKPFTDNGGVGNQHDYKLIDCGAVGGCGMPTIDRLRIWMGRT